MDKMKQTSMTSSRFFSESKKLAQGQLMSFQSDRRFVLKPGVYKLNIAVNVKLDALLIGLSFDACVIFM